MVTHGCPASHRASYAVPASDGAPKVVFNQTLDRYLSSFFHSSASAGRGQGSWLLFLVLRFVVFAAIVWRATLGLLFSDLVVGEKI